MDIPALMEKLPKMSETQELILYRALDDAHDEGVDELYLVMCAARKAA